MRNLIVVQFMGKGESASWLLHLTPCTSVCWHSLVHFLWDYLYYIIICQGDVTFASAGAEMIHVLVPSANTKPTPGFAKQLPLICSCCVIPLELFLLEPIM